jgi:hypothetical protein
LALSPSRWLSPVAKLGDRSYSLYLVHWPLLAFANNIALRESSILVNIALMGVALLWSEAQYRLVEQPFRTMAVRPRSLLVLAVFSVVVTGSSWIWQVQHTRLDPARLGNSGLSDDCNIRTRFAFQETCRTGPAPRMLIWGDSFAMHLADGIQASAKVPLAQATRFVCGPFLGIAPVDGRANPEGWGRNCIAFNDSVVQALSSAASVNVVILSSSLTQYVPGAEPGWQVLERKAGSIAVHDESTDVLLTSLSRTVSALHRMGKRVVLVAPPPSASYDIGRCHARLAEGKPIVPEVRSCDVSVESYRRFRAANLAFLQEVERRDIVPVFRFDAALCSAQSCRTTLDGTLLYRDGDHLSRPGSALLGQRLDLTARLNAIAR